MNTHPEVPPERLAKAAVLNLMKECGNLSADSAVISELELRSAGARVDLVIAASDLIAIEIKTSADKLTRLPSQGRIFSRAFPIFYAAIATKHVRMARRLIPRASGIIELCDCDGQLIAKEIRKANKNYRVDHDYQLSLIPKHEIRRLLRRHNIKPGGTDRSTISQSAREIDYSIRQDFVREYLINRYAMTSNAFHHQTSMRKISHFDLKLLAAWPKRAHLMTDNDIDLAFYHSLLDRFGREPFGPIPDDIRAIHEWYS